MRYSEFRRLITFISPATSVVVVLVAAVNLAGWILGSEFLVRVGFERGGIMMPITSIGLMFCALALWLRQGELTPPRMHTSHALASLAVLMGLAVAAEYALRIELPVDLLLFPETARTLAPFSPGRPSPTTALSLVAAGLAILLLDVETKHGRRPAQWLALFFAVVAGQAMVAYMYAQKELLDAEAMLLKVQPFNPMAFSTALSFVALSAGVLFARPERGLMTAFNSDNPSSYLARRLWPALVVLPLLMGWIGLMGARRGFYSTESTMSFVVVLTILFMTLLVSWLASALLRLDQERRAALHAAYESESLFRAIFENAGIGIGVVAPDGRPVKTNRALQQMLDYTAEELAALPFTRLTHPKDKDLDWQRYQDLISGKVDSYRAEKRFIRKDGKVICTQLNTSVARAEDGVARVAIAMVEDITATKRARDAQQRLTAILETTPDFVGIADAHGRTTYLNRAGREMVGIDEEDVAYLAIPDYHTREAAQRILNEAIPTAIRSGVWAGESELIGPDGSIIPVSQVIIAHYGEHGGVEYLSTVARDISERLRMESNLRFLLEASRALSGSLDPEQVLDTLLGLIVPRLADYCVIDVIADGGVVARTGLRHRNPKQQPLLEGLRGFPPRPGTRAGVPHALTTALTERVEHVDARWMDQASQNQKHREILGNLAPASIMIVPLLAGGRPVAAITFARTTDARPYTDREQALAEGLTSRAALALASSQMFRRLQEAKNARDEVLRVVAHDLRNPLNSIALSAGMLDELPADERAAEMIGVIQRSVDRANRLIQDLLDVARLESGRLSVERAPLDPAEVVTEAIELQRPLAEEKQVTLETDLAEHLERVNADRDRVLQVLSNLVDNAIRFTDPGGTITLAADMLDDEIRFSVADTGCGIPEREMPHLFDKFWKAKTQRGGTGLGLVICKGIVEAHGGRIWADSTVGRGSTFFFTLPVFEQQKGKRAA